MLAVARVLTTERMPFLPMFTRHLCAPVRLTDLPPAANDRRYLASV